MNRRERRLGRLYLLPLLLGLTGISLLVLEWVLRLEGFDAFGELKGTVVHCLPCLVYPLVLLVLYIAKVSPKVGRVFCFVSLGLTLLLLVLAYTAREAGPQGGLIWFPGASLFYHRNQLKLFPSFGAKLLFWSDLCFVSGYLSAVFTCTLYAFMKTKSIARNEAFDRKHAVLLQQKEPVAPRPEPKQPDEPRQVSPTLNEPTRVVELPEQYRG